MSAKAPPATSELQVAAAGGGLAAKLPMILLGFMVIANLGGTGVIAFRVLRPAPQKAEASKEADKKVDLPGPVVALDSFVVNLNEASANRYLKATFEVEVADAAVQKDFEEHRRELRDEILRYLSNLSIKETLGDANKSKIKADLLERADKSVGGKGGVKHLFFTEFVVQ